MASLRSIAVASLLLAAACTSGQSRPPRTTAGPPPETPAADVLKPSAAALRTADRVELTGHETGTMWTFENPPLDYWAATYGFHPTSAWLDHVRLSSVRYGQICSASFVSAHGLVMTNHHCARSCGEAVSTADEDYIRTGFYAATRSEEKLCPGLALDQLVGIQDVTAKVRAAEGGAADSTAVARRDSAIEALEAACSTGEDVHCQVVPLYDGGQYQLYRYRRWAPVKLVFLPELQAGFFGGDPDNFTYPRYALDVAFVRAYAADSTTPAETPDHLAWNPDGAGEGDLVFVTGNPGSTQRLITVSELEYERVYRHPFVLQILEGQRDLLRSIATRGPDAERAVRDDLFGIENTIKSFTGELEGLRDSLLVGRKIRWEREFRSRIEADPDLAAKYGDAWDRMAAIQRRKLAVSPPLNVNTAAFLGGPYEGMAAALVRYARETAKPAAERDPAFTGDSLAALKSFLEGPFRPDPEIAKSLLALRLAVAERWLPPDDPFRVAALRPGETPDRAAERLIAATRIGDPGFRRAAMEAGPDSLAADPLLALADRMVAARERLARRWGEIQADQSVQDERLADALFAAFGTGIPPDATFTLRISDGVVKRYPYNGTFAAPHTTFHGLYERAAAFGNAMPWALPAAFEGKQDSLDLDTPFDFVTTNDITGGNSGSPVVDRDGRVVGIAFDGNIEQLPNQFLFRTRSARTVAVSSAGILEALRVVYGAKALVDELTSD